MTTVAAGLSMVVKVLVAVALWPPGPVAVTFAVPNDGDAAAAGGNVVTYIWQTSMSTRWAEFLLFIAVVAQTFCTIASTTLVPPPI